MKNSLLKIKHSISGRLSLRVLIATAIIFTLTCVVYNRMAADKVREEATKHAQSELANAIHQIDAVLNAVEIAVENTGAGTFCLCAAGCDLDLASAGSDFGGGYCGAHPHR